MNWTDVLNRIEEGEGRTTEFTRGLGDGTKARKAMCAFANTEGGVIVLGVDDEQQIVGVKEDAEKVQERLTDFLSTGCSSPVSARIGRHRDPKGWVHWVEVPRQRSLEPLRCEGRVWIRRARSTTEPSATELQELYNAFGYILTEERTIQGADASHLDLQKFGAFLAAQGLNVTDDPQPEAESDLRSCGALADAGGELRPTVYGVLAFGKEPQKYTQTAGFWIEGVAYEGTDRASDVLQVGEAKGTADEQVNRAVGWFAGLGRFETYGEVLREDRRLLPSKAIREALVNAVTHRDYAIIGTNILLEVFADHVDVTSRGALPNHMDVQHVFRGALPRARNQQLVHFMLVSGFMERRGRGWPIMRDAMRSFNDTEPELLHDGDNRVVRVRFWLNRRP